MHRHGRVISITVMEAQNSALLPEVRLCPGRFRGIGKGGFVAALYFQGIVICDAWGFTKFEARQALVVVARDLGLPLRNYSC